MITFLIGVVIFLTILAAAIKFGNPNKEVQRKNQKEWTDNFMKRIK